MYLRDGAVSVCAVCFQCSTPMRRHDWLAARLPLRLEAPGGNVKLRMGWANLGQAAWNEDGPQLLLLVEGRAAKENERQHGKGVSVSVSL